MTSRGKLDVGAGAKLYARGGYEITAAAPGGGGGGRIAFAYRLPDETCEQLAESGLITGTRKTSRRYQDRNTFTERYPGATIDVSQGGGNTGDTDEKCEGTFGFIVPPRGCAIIFR